MIVLINELILEFEKHDEDDIFNWDDTTPSTETIFQSQYFYMLKYSLLILNKISLMLKT
jgi:hypothetical protein